MNSREVLTCAREINRKGQNKFKLNNEWYFRIRDSLLICLIITDSKALNVNYTRQKNYVLILNNGYRSNPLKVDMYGTVSMFRNDRTILHYRLFAVSAVKAKCSVKRTQCTQK